MKVLKRPHRSGSVRMAHNKLSPAPPSNSDEIVAALPSADASTSKLTEPHPLSDVLGTFGSEAWEEFRATLKKLRQQDAEDDTIG